MEITIQKEQLLHAQMQRLEALKLAFKTIDLFAIPSLDPERYEKFDEIRKYLTNHYNNKNK